jgi:hypothetical protein
LTPLYLLCEKGYAAAIDDKVLQKQEEALVNKEIAEAKRSGQKKQQKG